ncbi:28S ribosomal protein S5, mitochondrial-like [Anarrhichthys ocellatus]|uniref:28S ribosomal protein S5, mitochondrial-like n=1 Tax=Anarrhichthys ocellatus TaxID=433405 RepID=UPI0012EE5E7D|nr:28S ribosomal protein S5, mitochondrial-like [Anarrhichthys ocellatus]
MAASIRLCCALRVTLGGGVQVSQLVSRASAASLQRNPAAALFPATAWQQTRHGSFFNKLTAEELWKGVLAESGSGARKGRGKRTKRKLKRDLNRGQTIGEGRGGFLWPGLNAPVMKEGTLQSMSRRGESEQQEMQSELVRQRDEWERKRKMKVKRERGWTGNSWGGISLGAPDPGPNGGKQEPTDCLWTHGLKPSQSWIHFKVTNNCLMILETPDILHLRPLIRCVAKCLQVCLQPD